MLLSIISIVFILASFIGWGYVVAAGLGFRKIGSTALFASWGLAITPVIGGVFNALGIISTNIIFGYITLGFIACLAFLKTINKDLTAGNAALSIRLNLTRANNSRKQIIIMFMLVALVLAPLISNLGTRWATIFNSDDDYYAYLVFPQKMLQTGEIGEDPFNTRRLESALGGQSFYLALTGSLLPISRLNAFEWGLGLIIFFLLAANHAKEKRLFKAQQYGILFFIALMSWPIVNTTSVISGAALFYALIRTMQITSRHRTPNGEFYGVPSWLSTVLLISLIAAALSSAKSSHIPATAIIIILYFIVAPTNKAITKKVGSLLLVGLFTFMFLIPWMLAMYKSSGTTLYPIFGHGYHAPTESLRIFSDLKQSAKSILELFTSPVITGCAALLLILVNQRDQLDTPQKIAFVALIGTLIASLVILAVNSYGFYHTGRHVFSFAIAALIFSSIELIAASPPRTVNKGFNHKAAAFAIIAFTLGAHYSEIKLKFTNQWFMLFHSQNDSAQNTDKNRAELLELQYKTEEGKTILAYIDMPFLLDFKRNTIYAIDMLGPVSPPPGIPLEDSADEVRRYLLDNDIDYLMYSPPPKPTKADAKLQQVVEICSTISRTGNRVVIDLEKRHIREKK